MSICIWKHTISASSSSRSLSHRRYKRALCGKTVSIFFSPTLSEATRADLDLFFEMPFPYFLSQPFLFSTLEFYRSAKEAISFFGNDKLLPRSSFLWRIDRVMFARKKRSCEARVFDERVSKGEIWEESLSVVWSLLKRWCWFLLLFFLSKTPPFCLRNRLKQNQDLVKKRFLFWRFLRRERKKSNAPRKTLRVRLVVRLNLNNHQTRTHEKSSSDENCRLRFPAIRFRFSPSRIDSETSNLFDSSR